MAVIKTGNEQAGRLHLCYGEEARECGAYICKAPRDAMLAPRVPVRFDEPLLREDEPT